MRQAHIHTHISIVTLEALIFFATLSFSSIGAEPADATFFENRIRPILVQHCYECHSVKAGKSKGQLLVDSRASLLKGGETGPAIVPGDPNKSLFIRAISYTDESTEMPPKGKLSQAIVNDLTTWVKNGVPWPAEDAPQTALKKSEIRDTYEKLRAEHWCWQPMKSVEPPSVRNRAWVRGAIDQFVLATLEKQQLSPAPAAEKHILLRRLNFDLIGLPPTAAETALFIKDETPDAYEKAVNRLLASPHFGERWGRHWMDVVRYADSVGFGANITFDNAWRYRDYIIASFNSDKPYDQFLHEQIAGDLLPASSPEQSQQQRIAAGFLALGAKELAEYDKEKLRWDVIDEQLDTMGLAFMGMTLGCARCHDHKFDPIPTQDYYALAGILSSTETLTGKAWEGPISEWVEDLLVPGKENEKSWSDYDKGVKNARGNLKSCRGRRQELENLESQLEEKRVAQAPATEIVAATAAYEKKRADFRLTPEALKALEVNLAQQKSDPATSAEEIKRLTAELSRQKSLPDVSDKELARLEAAFHDACNRPHPVRILTVRDGKAPVNAKIRIRGDAHNLGAEVPRGFLSAVPGTATPTVLNGSGRLELARWLTQPDHPLTARVITNRIWSHLFGTGLVRTVDNFGVRGEAPTHPELLDYLSLEFVRNGWSMKKLIREIVLSRAYQMKVLGDAPGRKVDPENRLLWRQNRRRLEAEAIRDAMLQISGNLDPSLGGNTLTYEGRLFVPDSYRSLKYDPLRRRTVYVPVYRGALPLDILEVFNLADPGMVTGRRASTQVPTQALYLMNSPFVLEQAAKLALNLCQTSPTERVRELYLRVLGRDPSTTETQRALVFIASADADSTGANAWTQLCQALLISNEALFID